MVNERIIVFPKSKFIRYIQDSDNLRLLLIIVIFEIISLLPVFISVFEGNFSNSHLGLDALHDYGYYSQFCIGFPLVLFLINKYFTTFSNNLGNLINSNILKIDNDLKVKIINKINNRFKNIYYQILSVSISLTITILGLLTYILSNEITWNNSSNLLPISFAGLFIVPVVFILYYLAFNILIRISGVYLSISDIFKYDIDIQPLHPDGCGGLSGLGKISQSLNYSIIITGLLCAFGIYTSVNYQGVPLIHPTHFIILICYFTVATVTFFVPLRPATKKMKKAKEVTLSIINSGFNELNNEIIENIKAHKIVNQEKFVIVKKYKDYYDMTQAMPVYPYDIKTLKSFITSVLLPIVLYFAEYIFSNYIL